MPRKLNGKNKQANESFGKSPMDIGLSVTPAKYDIEERGSLH